MMSAPRPLPFTTDPVAERLGGLQGLEALVLHGVFTPSCARLSIEARRRRPDLAIVADPHDAYDEGLFATRSAAKRLYWTGFERPYLRRADLVVVSAPSHVSLLRDRGIRTNTLVAPPGLSPEDARQASRAGTARHRRPVGGRLRLLSLGRWDVREKGLDLLCEAADDPWLRSHINVRLVGPEYDARPDIESLLRRHRLENFEAVGYVDNVWPELAAADALVLPSRKEGFGLVALQALASGLPVVLSTAAGIAEYVDDDRRGVVLVSPSASAVRGGLHQLVDRHAELTVAAQNGSSRLAENFTYDRLLGQLLGALRHAG